MLSSFQAPFSPIGPTQILPRIAAIAAGIQDEIASYQDSGGFENETAVGVNRRRWIYWDLVEIYFLASAYKVLGR